VSKLRENVLVSTAAMVLVGLIRPGFHAIVNHTFGAEVNGRATKLIAVLFLATLPAASALPAVMVRHVSRAMGAGDQAEARGHSRLALITGLLLAALGAAVAVPYARGYTEPTLTPFEGACIAAGVVGYSGWRLLRALLLAVGRATRSLLAEVASVVALFVALGALVVLDAPALLLGAFAGVYVLYTALALPLAQDMLRGGSISAQGRRDFMRYNVLWFLGTATSIATRELSILYLDHRAPDALVGEVGVALSLLMLLAFAPRIIEVPLVHELSALGGTADLGAQRKLTEKALHWLSAFTFSAGTGAAILAAPILAIVGDVHTEVVAQAFALLAFAFMTEMVMTPATNLLVAEAPPSVLTTVGVASLLVALAWWATPWADGVLGVIAGLALSYALKAVAIGVYAKRRFGLVFFQRPGAKLAAAVTGAAAIYATLGRGLNPWAVFAGFEVLMLLLFLPEVREIVGAALARRGAA
jgi:O-antigen/teichoic acid export membrane protein